MGKAFGIFMGLCLMGLGTAYEAGVLFKQTAYWTPQHTAEAMIACLGLIVIGLGALIFMTGVSDENH